MNFYAFEICPEVIKVILLILGVASLIFLIILKSYLYISCGIYNNPAKIDGKVVIVTGATSGIGFETARELAFRGAKVILACRNLDNAIKVKDEIIRATGNTNIIAKHLDLSSLTSVRKFADDVNKNETHLHVLIHNAGTAESKIQLTENKLELTMATNHFGPFLLTHLLINIMKRSGPSRIVIVASELYRLACVNLEKLNPVDSSFPPYLYYVSKYVNIYFTRELARRLKNSDVTANCLHPGMIDSGIWRNVPFPLSLPIKFIAKYFFKTVREGSQTSVYLAVSEDLQGISGKYFMDCKESTLSSKALDDSIAKKIWDLSENFVGLKSTDPKI